MANEQNGDVNNKLKAFSDNMQELEQMSAKFSNFYFELMEQPDNSENALTKLDASITCAYANASIYWLYLMLKGTDLQGHAIKNEIGRVKKYHDEFNLLKKDAPKLNVRAARSFIRNALFDPNQTPQENNNRTYNKTNYYNNTQHNKRKRHWGNFKFSIY